MEKPFKWKGELTFNGTAKEFAKLAAILDSHPVQAQIPEWRVIQRGHLAGCNRIAVDTLLRAKHLEEIVADQPRFKATFIKDIKGGIRSPHLHLGNEIVLLNKERFKLMAGEVASALATSRVEKYSDYISVIGSVNALADDPVPIIQADFAMDDPIPPSRPL